MENINFCVIIVAGGSGKRFGADIPKLLVELAGKPIIFYTIRNVAKSHTNRIVLVVPEGYESRFDEIAKNAISGEKPIYITTGGVHRSDSVRRGLEKLREHCSDEDIVLIHDGARPLASPQLFDRCAEYTKNKYAVITALPIVETVKIVENNIVLDTPPREKFWTAQTPQGFLYKIINDALANDDDFTDDAAACEKLGHKVAVIMGERENIKITTPQDLYIAEKLIRKRYNR